MPNYDRIQDQLTQWCAMGQVMALKDAGFTMTDAIWLVYKAHMGKAECMIAKGV